MVKNVFTSDIEYDPRLTFRKARELGIKSVEENLAPMPRDVNFFIPKNKVNRSFDYFKNNIIEK